MKPAIAWRAFLLEGAILCVAFVAMLHTAGNELNPLAGWLAPLAMLRFVRQGKSRTLLLGLGVTIAAHMLAWRGVLPFDEWIYFSVTALVGAWFFTPFLADRLIGPRLSPGLRILLFPTAWVSMEFALANAGFGAWGLLGYTQFGVRAITQLGSIGGLYAISFLITSFAAVVNAILESRDPGARRMAFGYACLLVMALTYGITQLGNHVDTPSVRVAGIVVDNMEAFRDTWGPLTYGKPLTPEQAKAALPKVQALQQELLRRTVIEAQRGAQIVVWSEANALVFKHGERAFLERASEIAKRERIYLFATLATMQPGAPLAENKIVLIEPSGRIHDAYLKSHPTPGEASVPGTGNMRFIDTPFGRLAWAICYDFDFVELVRQAGAAGADILVDPAWEHGGMDPLHARMSTFRAIENGAALFRVTNGATSLATDNRGRVLASVSAADTTSGIPLVAHLPASGGRTPYSVLADALAGLCVGMLAIFAVMAFRKSGKARM